MKIHNICRYVCECICSTNSIIVCNNIYFRYILSYVAFSRRCRFHNIALYSETSRFASRFTFTCQLLSLYLFHSSKTDVHIMYKCVWASE